MNNAVELSECNLPGMVDLGGMKGTRMRPRRIGKSATALATTAALLAEAGVKMASAGESGALAACLGNSSLMVFHSTVLIQIGAPAKQRKQSACPAMTTAGETADLSLLSNGSSNA